MILLSDGAIPMRSHALMKIVMHHALAEQENENRQNYREHKLSNSERWRRPPPPFGHTPVSRHRRIPLRSVLRLVI
jgi:hypothetical protein